MKNLLLLPICILTCSQIVAQTWIPQGEGLLPVGYTVWSISAVDDTVIWVTASLESAAGLPVPLDHQLKVLRSVDGGFSWESHNIAAGRFSWDIHAVDAKTAWITTLGFGNGLPNTLFKTEDGGFTWTNKLIHSSAGVFIRKFDESHLLCQTNEYIARTEDGGEQWILDTIHQYLPNEFNTLAAGNNMVSNVGDTLWVGTALGRIVRFTNYGADYELIYTGSIVAIQSLTFADHLHGMLFFYKSSTGAFGLLRTSDGGSTWQLTPSKPQTTKEYNIVHVAGTLSTYVAVTDYFADAAEYFFTTDFGETWIKGGEIKDAQTNAVHFLNPQLGWASTGNITRAGEPLVYRWLGDLSTSVQHEPWSLSELALSPNPATTIIHYHFTDDDKKMHEQSIVDLNGHVLNTIKTYSPEANISDLPAGIYFLRITSDVGSGSQLFVKSAE